jgi:hypothetical protein
MDTLTEALRYRQMGLSCIPIYGVKDGICLCPQGKDCSTTGKHPAIPTWEQYRKTLPSIDTIMHWFTGTSHNVAILTGKISGNLVVIDLDNPSMGRGLGRYLPETMLVQTGKGNHVYVKTSEPMKSKKYKELKIDFQSDGKYVVAPPSTHKSGVQYTLVNPAAAIIQMPSSDLQGIMEKAETYAKVTNLIEADYQTGNRHEIALGLAIMARRSGFTKEQAKELLSFICSVMLDKDEEQDRLKTVDWTFNQERITAEDSDFMKALSNYAQLKTSIFSDSFDILGMFQDITILSTAGEVSIALKLKVDDMIIPLTFSYEQLEKGMPLWQHIHILAKKRYKPTKKEWDIIFSEIITRGRTNIYVGNNDDSDADQLLDSLRTLIITTEKGEVKNSIYYDRKNEVCAIKSITIRNKLSALGLQDNGTGRNKILRSFMSRGIVLENKVMYGQGQVWTFPASFFETAIKKLQKNDDEND